MATDARIVSDVVGSGAGSFSENQMKNQEWVCRNCDCFGGFKYESKVTVPAMVAQIREHHAKASAGCDAPDLRALFDVALDEIELTYAARKAKRPKDDAERARWS